MENMRVVEYQRQLIFYDPTTDRRFKDYPLRPTEEEILESLSPNNPQCPLNRIVSSSNDGNMRMLRRFAFESYKLVDRSCRGLNFGIYAGPGQGKTFVVKCWAETIGLPFVEIDSASLEDTWTLFQEICKVCKAKGIPVVPQQSEFDFKLPPCIVFFDEAHALSNSIRTGGLLKAMEYKDGIMRTQPSGKGAHRPMYTINCANVCWIAATTDPGLLYKESQAFYDRFPNHIQWNPATSEEIIEIVRHNYPQLDREACEQVAFYCKVPRKAIAFANQMRSEREMSKGTWMEAARIVASDMQIDEYGMPLQQVNLLKVLGQRPVAIVRLGAQIGVRREELESMILPPLMNQEKPLVRATRRGYAITRAGVEELEKRKISHCGDRVMAERIEM